MATTTTKKHIAESLGDVPLFARCTKRDLKIVARHIELLYLGPDIEVVKEGDPGEAFFLVLSGEVEVTTAAGASTILGTNGQFGELSLLDPAPRSATVTTLVETELAVLSLRMFRVILRDIPQISSALLGSLAGQLRDARQEADAS